MPARTMDSYRDRIRVLLPHYLAMLALILVILMGLEAMGADLARTTRWALVALIAIGYVVVLRITGYAPEPWS